MKTIVVYNSKTGFSKKYGQWIAEELKCESVKYQDMTPDKWQENDVIIYGSGILAGSVKELDKVKTDLAAGGKKLLVYATGATAMGSAHAIEKIKQDNFKEEEQAQIPFFYFEGGLNYEKMGFMPKMMLKMMYKAVKNKKDKTEDDIEMMRTFEKSCDKSNKEYIKPLIESVRRCNDSNYIR